MSASDASTRQGVIHQLFPTAAGHAAHQEAGAAGGTGPGTAAAGLNAAPAPSGFSREDVILAFELLLGRPPETEDVIAHHQKLASRAELGETIRSSAEFQARHAESQLAWRSAARAVADADSLLLAEHSFHDGGNGLDFLRDGWSRPEAEFCWSIGFDSHIDLPVPHEAAGDVAMILRLVPFRNHQRVSVDVEGVELVSTLVERRVQLACRIPAHLLAGRDHLRVALHHPDAASPRDDDPAGDDRVLGLGLVGLRLVRIPAERSELDDRTVLRNFESLGDNCEFGFLMQRGNVFGSGLLRFNVMPVDQLLRGLASRFAGFPDRSLMRLERHDDRTGGHEYIVYEDGYTFAGHTTITASLDEEGQTRLLDREHTRLAFLKRMLLDELDRGETIFVFKRNVVPSEAEVMALWLGIRALGHCSLLWVAPEAPGLPAGTVTLLAEGLYKGYVDRFAPYTDAEDVSASCWMTICRRTLHLSRLDLVESA